MMNTYIEPMSADTFKSRVTTILENMNRSKSWLADCMGISRQALNYLLANTNGGKYTSHIAEILNINPDWLSSGEGDVTLTSGSSNTIPLLKLESVSAWLNGTLQDLYEVIPAECHETSDTFAITLDNSSMETEFAKDSVLVFRPSANPSNGDYVLVRLNIDNQEPNFIFRKYVKDGSGVYLKALDPTFRTITTQDNFDIIALLIEQRRRFHD